MSAKRPTIQPQVKAELVTNDTGTVFGIHTPDDRVVLLERQLAIRVAMDILLRTGHVLPNIEQSAFAQ